MPRQNGSEYRCNDVVMGPMGPSLPVSSDESSFEGFSQTFRDQLPNSNINNTAIPSQTMVHGTEATPDTVNNNDSEATTKGREQVSESPTGHNTCRLEVIKRIYENRMPNCKEAIKFIAEPIKKTSTTPYQQKWEVFLKYIVTKHSTRQCSL